MIPLPPRAYLFIGLNVARFLSILTLILTFASTIVVMVNDIHAIKRGTSGIPPVTNVNVNGTEYYYECDYLENSTVPIQSGGSMFSVINHIFIIFQCIILTLAEMSLVSKFFNNFIPVLGKEHGVAILGFMQIFIGAAVLSHHVPTFALVSAFFLFAMGIINVLLGIAFRASIKEKRSLTSWRERVKKPTLPRTAADFRSAAAAGVLNAGGTVFTNMTGSSVAGNMMAEKAASAFSRSGSSSGEHSGYGFGRQGEKQAGLKGFLISRPQESLPRYVPRPSASTNSRPTSPPRATSRASISSYSSEDSVDNLGAANKANRI
ncbi:hypothetical protein DL93DRAFT_2096484 [Clavulina sp. PMI_390]|nr:hypothetical protein DL93DRAFT_2096484 [Clavulina sp. PMI_390]